MLIFFSEILSNLILFKLKNLLKKTLNIIIKIKQNNIKVKKKFIKWVNLITFNSSTKRVSPQYVFLL